MSRLVLLSGILDDTLLLSDFLLIASPQDDDGITALFSLYGASSTSVSPYLKICLLQNCVGCCGF
jgi:hypothetical protein